MSEQPADEGMTLVETLVGMLIFSICFAVFVAGLQLMVRDTNRTQQVSDATDQMRKAFQAMDLEARYAESVNAPAVVDGAWWVEFRDPIVDGGNPRCTQWRYAVSSGLLEERSWDSTQPAGSTWRTLATGLSTDAALLTDATRQPFTRTLATQAAGTTDELRQQTIAVRLESPRRASDGSRRAVDVLQTTFTAQNSSSQSDSNLGSAVCSPTTNRTR
ncbi:PulJ/GspJ family protein [Kineococcus sp. SYSU DK006]|uniref:PulJ/GspJ family protein n=1 Tax=Kineococcus sp. SYSU DK006 TaxID=3383127 RepID=UPI003D7D039C